MLRRNRPVRLEARAISSTSSISPIIASLSPPGRIALVGAGAFGRFCLNAYQRTNDLPVLAVADSSPAALAQVTVPGARLETDWYALVEDTSIEVIHVATPPYLREEVVFAALDAGKSVFCEKPLALTLADADEMMARAERRNLALGVNYVMRHQPAYRLLERLAGSGLLGSLRTLSFQNFAQHVPSDHWFWQQDKSGGIFVEHGVHFFDAYARIAGAPSEIRASAPRREAVDATVHYASGALGRYYHEFAFPQRVERALGTSFFERGYVEIEGWIPTRLSGSAEAPLQTIRQVAVDAGVDLTWEAGETTHFSVLFSEREASYQAGIVNGMRDVVRRHRDHGYTMTVSTDEARASLALALRAQKKAECNREHHKGDR